MALTAASRLGLSYFSNAPQESWEVSSAGSADVDTIITAVYRQVLGNAHVMESDRLTAAESQLRRGGLSVRGFVRAVAKSELYRNMFFTSCSTFRAIELNFRHLLGRPPRDFDELKMHSNLINTKGFDAEIDTYIDSDEYSSVFGENIVPYIRGYNTEACQKMIQFSHTFQLVRGGASSSRSSFAGKNSVLNSAIIQKTPKTVIPPSSRGAGAFNNPPGQARTRQEMAGSDSGKLYRLEVTGYRANKLNRIPKMRYASQVYIVPFDRLFDEYQRIHRQGAVISSVTPVSLSF